MKIFFLLFFLWNVQVFAQGKPLVIGLPYQVKRITAVVEYQSFIADSLKDAGFDMRTKITTVQVPYEHLVAGELDGVLYDDLGIKEGRKNTVSTSFPIIKTRSRYFYLKDNPKFKKRDFSDRHMASLKGCISTANKTIEAEALRRKLSFINANNPYQNVTAVLEGQADYFIAVEEVGKSAVAAHPLAKDKFAFSDVVFTELPLYLTLHKKFHKDMPRIEEALKKRLRGDLSKYPLISDNLNKNP
ncbi:transporter substrate-binding domain-containing protein [Bdellovibrio sp. 22V]|uniref:transporter substrate-binding domain-containing protein n=1 Tax=Bdellovibrio sp. 22V TaxID=3044166 RepID=UPI002542B311|nr:transporter substrate-binding domain-containing protein [Bdellovibrio sp. 22V]WII71876.1 transporter substrate-binding domain-containing protein [Bdellovibrio sp. 22V]